MKLFMHQAIAAISPVVATVASIAVLRAAEVPMPTELAWHALPGWAIFASLIYTSTHLVRWGVGRVFGAPQAAGAAPGAGRPTG